MGPSRVVVFDGVEDEQKQHTDDEKEQRRDVGYSTPRKCFGSLLFRVVVVVVVEIICGFIGVRNKSVVACIRSYWVFGI